MGELGGLSQEKLNRELFHACERKQLEEAKILLERGANVNARNDDGWTRLMVSALMGHRSLVQLLLSRGANPFVRDRQGWTARMWAEHVKWEGIVRVLETSEQVQRQKLDPFLLSAVADGSYDEVKNLLDNGADPDAVDQLDPRYNTPLIIASAAGHADIVRLLLERGASVDSFDVESRTPLWWAGDKGHSEAVELLLQHGANKDSADEDGCTPLMAAVYGGHLETVKFLINMGADANRTTALSIARERGHTAIAALVEAYESRKIIRENRPLSESESRDE